MIYKAFQDIKLSRLGMGNMRLPALSPAPGAKIDRVATQVLLDKAMESGVNYYDTAYVYNNGESEEVLGEAMKKHPRESFYYATKFFIQANPDYKAVFDEQLKRLQTDYIDFYLLHCLTDDNYQSYIDSGAIAFFEEQKRLGKIRYFGFSSHSSPETLEKMASQRKWDFAQIQLNYFDWSFGTAKREYEILQAHDIPIMVMEPCRGGRLAALTSEAEALLKEAHPDWSIASWAFRFVKALPQVQVVLSGMNDMTQMADNSATFSENDVLSEEDLKLLMRACELFHDQVRVPCTECRYCCDGCHSKINIPAVMKIYNQFKLEGTWALEGLESIDSEGKPADCIGCGACKEHCPQGIDIPGIMAELTESISHKPD